MKHILRRAIRSILTLSIALSAVPLASGTHIAQAETIITSNISTNTTWTLAGSPYIVQNNIQVQQGVTLTIQPGVQVRVASGHNFITVYGSLIAEGTAQAPIQFLSNAATQTPGGWAGLHLNSSGAAISLDHCVVSGAGNNGAPAVDIRTGAVTLRNCRIEKNAADGIQLNGRGVNSSLLEGGIRPRIEDTQILEAGGFPIRQTTFSMNPTYRNLTFSPGITNALAIQVGLGDGTDIDVTVNGSPAALNGAGIYLPDGVGIGTGRTFTVTPGTTLRMGRTESNIYGRLVMDGTPTQRITLTGNTSTPTPGTWAGLYFKQGSSAILSNCNVSGGGLSNVGGQVFALMRLESSNVSIRNCRVEKSSSDGIRLDAGISPRIEDTHILDVAGFPLFEPDANTTPTYRNLSFSPGVTNALMIGFFGANFSSVDRTLDGSPEAFNGAGILFPSGFNIQAGRTLTVTPGSTLRVARNFGGYITGRLVLEGTPARRISLTGNTPVPETGVWGGVRVATGGHISARDCEISGMQPGDYNGLRFEGGSGSIQYCTFRHNSTAMIFAAITAPTIRYNQFVSNTFGINNPTSAVIDARRNWWGDASGPKNATSNPNGLGVGVSDRVLFDPWLRSAQVSDVSFEPRRGGNVATTTVRFYNVPINPAMTITLKRSGQPDIVGAYRGPANDTGVDYAFALNGAAVGSGTFSASGVPTPPVIPDPFEVMSAPANAQDQARDSLVVEVIAPESIRRVRPFPVMIHFSNRGLVDAPPTEFRLYAKEGTEFVPADDLRYLIGTINDGVPAGNPNTWRQVATFIVPGIRPGVDDYMLVNVKTSVIGNVPLQLESVTSAALTPVFTQTQDFSLRLTGTANTSTDTKIDASFALENGAFTGGGSVTVERLGPTSYFTPTVQVTNSNGTLTYIVTAAVPKRGVTQVAQNTVDVSPAAVTAEGDLERVRQVIQMTQQTADKLRGFVAFNQADRVRAHRLLYLDCILRSPEFNPNNLDDQKVVELLGKIGDIDALTFQLSQVKRAGLLSVDMQISLMRLDQAVNGLYESTMNSDFYRRRSDETLDQAQLMQEVIAKCLESTPKVRFIPVNGISSYDPNSKTGTLGSGPRHGIRPSDLLNYSIGYENVPTATAPAQIVVISDTLDASLLDLSSLRLTSFTISDTIVPVGNALVPFTRDIDLRATRGVIVRADVALNNNVLVVTLTSLDPLTLQPPVDALAGFLPPNTNGFEGQGYVFFSIKPKAGLPLRTVISNRATIFFDDNAPIDTPTWSNTIGLPIFMPQVRRQ